MERNGKRIACEIGVTTSKEWELHNIEKCLAAGYEVVIAVPVDEKAKMALERYVAESLPAEMLSKVLVMDKDEVMYYFDKEVAKEVSTETRMKGHRVKVEYGSISQEEMKNKRSLVTKVVTDTLKNR